MSNLIRAYDAMVDDVNRADRTLVAKISTAGVDRYRTVIDTRGGRLENYRKNPAVLWEHGRDPRRFTDPIGRNVWIKHNGGQRPDTLLARTKFLEDDFSQQRFEWYRDVTLNAFSISILPVDERSGPPTREELRASPAWETAQTVYREWDLAEYSGTTIPGNADCLVSERAAKMLGLVERGLLWLPDDVMSVVRSRVPEVQEAPSVEEPADALAEVVRRIVKKNGKYFVYSEDGTKRLGGPYATRQEAAKRLGQVEHFKHKDERAVPPQPRLDGARLLTEIAQEMASERRTLQQALRDEVIAMIDLVVFGRV